MSGSFAEVIRKLIKTNNLRDAKSQLTLLSTHLTIINSETAARN